MDRLDIRVNIKSIMDYSESLKKDLSEETILSLIEQFSLFLVDIYLMFIQDSMCSRVYKGKWEPVDDENYLKYIGTTPQEHIYDSIKSSMSSKKIGNNYIVGIDQSKKYKGSKLSLVQVINAIEYGTSKFNARPIFRKILTTIRKDILDLWRGYLTLKNII